MNEQKNLTKHRPEEDVRTEAKERRALPKLVNRSERRRGRGGRFKRLLRFRLATLIALITAVGVWLGLTVPEARRQKNAVEAILSISEGVSSTSVEYSFEFDSAGHIRPNGDSPWPKWLRRLVGDDYLHTVVGVSLDGDKATDADLHHLSELPHLTRIDLEYCPITDKGLEYIVSTFPDLVRLDLQTTATTSAGLRHLRVLKRLEILLLGDVPITDESLTHVGELKQLRHLALRRTAITGSGLEYLVGLSNLESLDLDGNPITDKAIAHLQRLSTLKELRIQGTQLSRRAVEELSNALPQCKIDFP